MSCVESPGGVRAAQPVRARSASSGAELVKQSAEESSSAEIDPSLEMDGLVWPLVV